MLFIPEVLNAPIGVDAYDACKQMIENQPGKYKHLSSGSFGSVYDSKESDVVYKIGTVDCNDGYLSFLKSLAFKGKKNNPLLPKIFGVRFIMDRNNKKNSAFIVAMEKLKEAEVVKSYSSEYDKKKAEVYSVMRYLAGDRYEFDSDEDFETAKKNVVNNFSKEYFEHIEDVATLIKHANKTCEDNCLDMHTGNVMQRENGELVITDPIS